MGRNYDDPLEFLLDGEAESLFDDGRCRDLTPSAGLKRAWKSWKADVDQAISRWQAYPIHRPIMRGDITTSDNVAYLVYQTLAGSGRSVEDGDWDHFFVETASGALKNLKTFLKKDLNTAYGAMEEAIRNEAYHQCGGGHPGDDVGFSHGEKLFTWGALEKKNLSGFPKGDERYSYNDGDSPKMRLTYFPVNRRYMFTMGDSVISLSGEERSFQTKAEAVSAARRLGLRVDKQDFVHPVNPSNMDGVR